MSRVLRPLSAPDTALLPKILAAFVAVLALASLLTLLLETRLTRQQLETQAVSLFAEAGDVLDARITGDAVRTNQLMATVSQGLSSEAAAPLDMDQLVLTTLSVVRTSDAALELVGVIDVDTGQVSRAGLPARASYQDAAPDEAEQLARASGSTQRVVPLREGGYGVAYVLPIRRIGPDPRVLVTGYPLDDLRARSYRAQTGVDDVEIVVDDQVVATTADGAEAGANGDPSELRQTQRLDDGRLVRYVALGADRAWDTPAAIGLISEDPLATLDGGLAQTRVLMVALLVVVGGALAFALARVLTRPLVDLTETATAISGGELDRSFHVDRRDEIGRLADALERMRRALRAQLLVIRHQAEALQEAARRIVRAQDTERQRIAQDLHDSIQQQLVVLRMQVSMASSQLQDDPDPERIREATASLSTSIDRLLDDLRSTGQALFPAILRDRGLGGALFSLAGRAELPVDVVLEPDPLPRTDRDVEVNAYFLATEAVANALKHADAERIVVTAQHEGEVLRIRVEDDGRGFDPGDDGHRGGLVHMRDRVNALGGSLQLLSAPDQGTTVTALFPLAAEPSVAGTLEVEQDGRDTPVELELLGEAELAEDGVGMLLDRSIRDRQVPRDRGVPPS